MPVSERLGAQTTTFVVSVSWAAMKVLYSSSETSQTDIWKSFEMVRSVSERKMQSDDGKMMKFMISFEAVWKFVSEEVVMHECLRAPDAQTIIFVVLVSAWELKLLHL